MLTTVAIVLSIVLQIIAVAIVISMIKGSKYKSSWILLSVGLMVMAFRRFLELMDYYHMADDEFLTQLNNWLGVLISIIIVIGIFFLKKMFDFIAMMQEKRQQSEKQVLSAILSTEEKERKRMAGELHDGLGPLLSSLKMSVHALKSGCQYSPEQLIIHQNISASVSEAIKSLREISYNLSPSVLEDFGLLTALRSFVGKTQPVVNFKLEFASNILDERKIEKDTAVILYRSVCELITNATKHEKAT